MKRLVFPALVFIVGVGCFLPVLAQTPAPQQSDTTPAAPRILGDVTGVNREKHQLTIKTSAGEFTVQAEEPIICKRVAPDAKNLEGAETITFGDIRLGDRVWARSTTPAVGVNNAFLAKQLVLMSATSIAERNQREREAWQRRGIQGEITAVDSVKKEFTVKVRDGSSVVIALSEQATIRRFPPGSVEFTSSKIIAPADIKAGDVVLGRGERSADGQRFTAESLITGDIPRPTFGQVKTVDLEKQEITVQGRNGLTVLHLTAETMLRRMPEEMMQPRPNGEAGGPPANGDGQGQPRRRMGFNPEAMMERLKKAPELKLNELKPGEYVMANGPKLADGKSINALFILRVPAPNNDTGGPGFGGGFGDITTPQ